MPSGHRGDGYTGNRGIATGERGRRGLDMSYEAVPIVSYWINSCHCFPHFHKGCDLYWVRLRSVSRENYRLYDLLTHDYFIHFS